MTTPAQRRTERHEADAEPYEDFNRAHPRGAFRRVDSVKFKGMRITTEQGKCGDFRVTAVDLKGDKGAVTVLATTVKDAINEAVSALRAQRV